jgi:hypothetical protein
VVLYLKGQEEAAAPLLQALTEARHSALTALDPSRTIGSAEAAHAEARK